MNQKELKELIEYLIEKDIAEFELERGDVKVRIKRARAEQHAAVETRYVPIAATAEPVVQAPAGAVPARAEATPVSGAPAAPAESKPEAGVHTVKSPIVGTFYESASPGAPAFAKVGDTVEAGQVLCIIEAMKLMNEIESDVAGEIIACHVKNAQPIEYNQPLFDIRVKQ